MQIREIEERTGLERSSIRFYEKEGLIHPERLENGYREYREEDLQALYKIKLFRSLHMTVEEIKEIFSGGISMSKTLEDRIRTLEDEEGRIHYAKEVCMVMKSEVRTLEDLDGLKYLHLLEEKEKETGTAYYPEKEDEIPQIYAPWRRFFARMLDLSFYTFLVTMIRVFVFRDLLRNHRTMDNIVDVLLSTALMLVIEPLLLSKLGTTPGKSLWGLVVRKEDGEYPSYREAFERTFGVLYYGLAFNITFVEVYTLYKSYKRAEEQELQPWEDGYSYKIKDEKPYRTGLFIAFYALYFFMLYLFMGYQTLPPNRGELTIAEFSENFQYYEEYFSSDSRYHMNQDGKWVRMEWNGEVFPISDTSMRPDFQFEQEGETLKSVYFQTDIGSTDELMDTNGYYMGIAYLSMAGAREPGAFFSALKPEDIMKEIFEKALQDFTLNYRGVVMDSQVDSRGYVGVGDNAFMVAPDDSPDNYFRQTFKVSLP